MIDLIGDIHGHADKLKALLRKLGYNAGNGNFHHPSHTVVFVGDYIDRGPQIPETLEIVRRMVDNGNAVALMGNHEYNALCYHKKGPNGCHLRPHSRRNTHQHCHTLDQFEGKAQEYEEWIAWFQTLPLFYETPFFRAVHACWDDEHIATLKSSMNGQGMNDELLHASTLHGSLLYKAIDDTLKGKEIPIPRHLAYEDYDDLPRTDIRIRWWDRPDGATYRSFSAQPQLSLPNSPLPEGILANHKFYNENEKPVFFGHYWQAGEPELMRDNVCCLDFGVAREGHLVAYRFNGEKKLDKKNFVFI